MYMCLDVTFLVLTLVSFVQVVRCCIEHAASVAKTFLTSDVVVTDIKEPAEAAPANPMDASGYGY